MRGRRDRDGTRAGDGACAVPAKVRGRGVWAADGGVANAVCEACGGVKLVVGPGGAMGLAALLAGRPDVKGKIGVAILSGGNVDKEMFARLIAT